MRNKITLPVATVNTEENIIMHGHQ